jgi:excisionase family DNA binding protein
VPDEFMTVAEAANTLKLDQQTIRNWIDAGTLPAVRIGRRVRIKRSDFDALVDAGYSSPKQAQPTGIWDGEILPPEGL